MGGAGGAREAERPKVGRRPVPPALRWVVLVCAALYVARPAALTVVYVGWWIAPELMHDVVVAAPWVAGFPLLGVAYPQGTLALIGAALTVIGVLLIWGLVRITPTWRPPAVTPGRAAGRWFALLAAHSGALMIGSALMGSRFLPVTQALERATGLPRQMPLDTLPGMGQIPLTDTDDFLASLNSGIFGAREEISLVAIPALLLRHFGVSWGWIITVSMILRVGIHTHYGWGALGIALPFGLLAILAFWAWGMWTPLWVAHFAGNFALGLGRASWLASFPFLEVLRDVAVPVLGIVGILIVVWRAFAPRASIAGVTPAANKRQKLP